MAVPQPMSPNTRGHGERGYATSWIQTTATLGFFLSLLVIGLCRIYMDAKMFADWGWRIPFLVSLVLLVFSVYIRLKLNESPIFQKMKEEGKGSKAPLTDSFLRYPNNKYVLLALLGATAGQGVVWYTGQFYALFFLTRPLKLDLSLRLRADRASRSSLARRSSSSSDGCRTASGGSRSSWRAA